MSFLYITEYDANLSVKDGAIIVKSKVVDDRELQVELLEGILIYGNASITKECSKILLQRGIPVTLLSKSGAFFGRIESTKHVNIIRQRAQFRKGDDPDFCLSFAKLIIEAKINNQIVVLRRYNRHRDCEEVEKTVQQMTIQKSKVASGTALDVVMGTEGICARYYFAGLAMLVNDKFKFSGRSKMPPRDPFNSLLSLGYTMLMHEAYNAAVNKGLHPYAGFLHKDKTSHPALASDLIEEWRATLVDSLVMNLINSGAFKPQDFEVDEETQGVNLTPDALRRFIRAYEEKLSAKSRYIEKESYPMTFRAAIMYQAGSLAKAIETGDCTVYSALTLR